MASKATRWNLRVAAPADSVVREAAVATDRTLTEFVREAALGEAERVLADRTRFSLEAAEWDRFVELLDRPVLENPRLAKLFSKRSAFE